MKKTRKHEDITYNYHGGNPRSDEAHESIKDSKPKQQKRILEFLYSQGNRGATSDETEIAIDLAHQSCSARFSELKASGHIIAIGKRLTRRKRSADVCVFNFSQQDEKQTQKD